MQNIVPKFYKLFVLLLAGAILAPSIANATPRPLDPGTVHVRVMKRGVNRFIGLQERNGVDLFGRIIDIGDKSFILQLHNDPQTTEVFYTDVAYLRTGLSTGEKVFMVAGIAAVAGGTIYGFVHIHDLQNKTLMPPALP